MKVGVFIVGAPKAGTTSLHHHLDEHPDIVMSSRKETDYFSSNEILANLLICLILSLSIDICELC